MTIERASSERPTSEQPQSPGLLERLAQGPVICAEGYLFELERRGYLQAGPFVPEVVLEYLDCGSAKHLVHILRPRAPLSK